MAGRPTNKPAPAFGGRLAALRKAHGLTQPKMAEMLGISPAMLAYYERKATNPTAEFIRKAAAVLNVSVDQLLGHEVKNGRKPGPPSRLQQLTQQLSELPRNKQKMVVEMLEAYLQRKPANS
jgi:transcriptional regulator with XRE-family HTH domain